MAMEDYESLLKSVQRENNLNEIILKLSKNVDDPNRLKEILQGINIGEKRKFNEELKIFIYYNEDLPSNKNEQTNKTIKETFMEEIDKGNELFDQIEEIITKKLGIDEVKKYQGDDGINKNTFSDFDEKMDELALESSLKSIETSQKIIQQSIPDIHVTKENYEEVMDLLDDINEDAGSWLSYLEMQKKNRNFTLINEEMLDLYNITIDLSKKTLKMEAQKRKEIEEKFNVKGKMDKTQQLSNTRNKEQQSNNNERNENSNKLYTAEEFEDFSEIRNVPTTREKFAKKVLKQYRRINEDDRDKIEELVNNVSKNGFSGRTIAGAVGGIMIGRMVGEIGQSQKPVERPGGGMFPPPREHHHEEHCNHDDGR
jgi:hypothetical protein